MLTLSIISLFHKAHTRTAHTHHIIHSIFSNRAEVWQGSGYKYMYIEWSWTRYALHALPMYIIKYVGRIFGQIIPQCIPPHKQITRKPEIFWEPPIGWCNQKTPNTNQRWRVPEFHVSFKIENNRPVLRWAIHALLVCVVYIDVSYPIIAAFPFSQDVRRHINIILYSINDLRSLFKYVICLQSFFVCCSLSTATQFDRDKCKIFYEQIKWHTLVADDATSQCDKSNFANMKHVQR